VSEEGYVGEDVHLAARVAACGHGGQIVLSKETASLLDGAALKSLGSHRLKDVSEPVTIYQLGGRTFPHLKTIANSNLPTTASSFLGREAELYEADSRLQETRLLTVIGPGGAGKTRFALELAIRARDERFSDYEDGVFSAFLSSLRDPSLVLTTIAVSLDVREQPGQSIAEALSAHLAGKKLLLLLDNVEHLMEAVPALSALLSACPGLAILATSRERLRLQGESVYELPPLREDESVALFCERAQTEPDDATRELCAQLEGLPLAIELAAARTSVLTPQQIATRLSQRLDFLKGGPDRDPRQETLRATIEWSYDLLSPEEKQLLARLSVFADGCTLEAAEEICDADIDTLQSLIEKSLLRFTDSRYWLLETIREYAAERLKEVGSADRVRDRHLLYFCEWAERIEPELKRIDQLLFLNRLEADHANLRTALDHGSNGSGDVVFSARLAAALVEFWDIRSYYDEARMRFGSIISHRDEVPSVLFAEALYGAGKAAHRQGDQDDGCELTRQAVGEFERAEDLTGLALALGSLAFIHLWRGETEHALQDAERSVATAEQLDDPWVEACALAALSAVRGELKDTVGEVHLLEESLRRFVEVGDLRSQAIEQLNLGVAAVESGEHERALTFFADAETNARAVDDLGTVANALSERGDLALLLGRLDDAARDFDEALQLGSSYGMDHVVSRCRNGIGTIAER
jgi:predicted ATPase